MKLLLHACCGPCSLEPTRLLKAAGHDITIYYANSNIHPAEEYEHRLATLRAWAADAGFEVLEGPYDPATWEACAGRIGDAAIAEVERARARADAEGERGGEIEGHNEASDNRCKTVTDTNHGDVSPAGATLSTSTANSTAPRAAVLSVDPARREARCRACYRLRLEETARVAAERGFEGIGTTLSVSPSIHAGHQRGSGARSDASRGRARVRGLPTLLRRSHARKPRAGNVPSKLLRLPHQRPGSGRRTRRAQGAARRRKSRRTRGPCRRARRRGSRTPSPQSRARSLRQEAGTQARHPKSPARTGEIAARLHLPDEYAPPPLAHCTRKSKTAGEELAPASQSKKPDAFTRFPHRASPRANENAFRFSLPEERKAFDQTPTPLHTTRISDA